MRFKAILILGFLVLALCYWPTIFCQFKVEAPTSYPVHNRNTGLNYTKIQDALNASETLNGHTIFVDSREFKEHVIVNKSVTLIGENPASTIIDGNWTGGVVTLEADNVNITGFTITNSGGFSEALTTYGILVESDNNYLSRNVIANNSYGIVLSTCYNNTLKENNMTGNELNFGVAWNPGLGTFNFLHDIDDSNKVDGLPIYYWIDQHDKQIPTDASCVYAVNCTGILVRNIAIGHSIVCFAGTNNSRIENLSCNSGVICLTSAQNNLVAGNKLENSQLSLIYSKVNVVVENDISGARRGIYLHASQNNSIFHNNFIDNTLHVEIDVPDYNNFWDSHVEGNYWSDYAGVDSNQDGIGDQPYTITQGPSTPPELIQYDYYPLMGMFSSFNVTYFTPPLVPHACNVSVISDSTISDFVAPIWIEHPEIIFLQFNVTGEEESTGFCRVNFPTAMMNGTYHVSVNGTEIPCTLLPCSDANYSYLYFTYRHSTEQVIIIPEFL